MEFNFLSVIYFTLFFIMVLIHYILDRMNTNYLKKEHAPLPDLFKDFFIQEKVDKMKRYTIENNSFSQLTYFISKTFLIIVLFSGVLNLLDKYVLETTNNIIFSGILFFAIISLVNYLISVPFDLYHTFVIEKKFEFNTQTMKTWIFDQIKSILLSVVLGFVIMYVLFFIYLKMGRLWWFWGWLFVFGFGLTLSTLYPVLLAPLFNKFSALEDENFKKRIKEMFANININIKEIFVMDAKKRTKHSNAYFTGLGKTKRIVLFDTLLENHTQDEILAVLSHEAGHWKKKHVLKNIILSQISSIIGLYIAGRLLNWPYLYRTFGLENESFFVGFFLLTLIFSPVSYFLSPISVFISRFFEKQADKFSFDMMKSAEAMKMALIKLNRDNLSNLYPHPFYSAFYYSHPPIMERIRYLDEMETNHDELTNIESGL